MIPDVMVGMNLRPAGTDESLFTLLTYRATQPYAVRLGFVSDDCRRTADVVFARELLIDALIEDAPEVLGEGTVQIAQTLDHEQLLIRIWDDGEWFELTAPRARVQHAVDLMLDVVPMGREADLLDIDGVLKAVTR